MTAITIRLRDADDRKTIEVAKAATRQTTAAKALMSAARKYPIERDKLTEAHRRISALQCELNRLQCAVQDWQRARELEHSAAARLEDILSR